MNAWGNPLHACSHFHVARHLLEMGKLSSCSPSWSPSECSARLEHFTKFHRAVWFSAWGQNQKCCLHAEREMVWRQEGPAPAQRLVCFCQSLGLWLVWGYRSLCIGRSEEVSLPGGREVKDNNNNLLLASCGARGEDGPGGSCHNLSSISAYASN